MELGSHTVTHPNLLLLTRDEVKSELLASKQKIEEESGGKCVSFCYPHGLCSPEIGTLVSNAGYRVAVTTKKPGWNTSATNIFNLNRAYIPRSAKVHRLALGLS
jgi:peptidoglycan/xylan/chitin deacetylase (PgdA/CDA1 family)